MQWSSESHPFVQWLTRPSVLGWLLLVNAELLVVLLYLLVAPVSPRTLWLYAVPFVWIDVAVWALDRTTPAPTAARRQHVGAGLLAVCYFLVLGYVGGLYGAGIGELATGLRIELQTLPPGWSPALLYAGEHVRVALLPFKLLGYGTLAWLVYVTALDTAGSLTASVLGLFSCVSCVLPVIAGLLGSVLGSGGALVVAANAQGYLLSTGAFVLTVVILVWQPTAGAFSRLRT